MRALELVMASQNRAAVRDSMPTILLFCEEFRRYGGVWVAVAADGHGALAYVAMRNRDFRTKREN